MFADNWFDAVTAFETVYFWPDLLRCFREVWRVLKPGGAFFFFNGRNGDTDKEGRLIAPHFRAVTHSQPALFLCICTS